MAKITSQPPAKDGLPRDIAWRAVWLGYAIALPGTLAVGGAGLWILREGMWWVAGWSLIFLFVGGFIAGALARTPEPLNGALIGVFFFATFLAVIFLGEFLALLPDPLPGLPHGDSTFYFVWPLAQAASATLGASLGGWFFAKRGR